MTVGDLLAELTKAQCPPAVEGEELVFATAPPDHLAAAVRVLQTGVRAVLTSRKWYGIDAHGRGAGRPDGVLEPGELLPATVRLLTTEGDAGWDRLPLKLDKVTARLFAPASKTRAA